MSLSPALQSVIKRPDAYHRADESDDTLFYRHSRMVQHLDATALAVIEQIIGDLLANETQPAILDLMASFDSHLPDSLATREVVGLGMNEEELRANPRITERILHDLNRNPRLPFDDSRFDAVLNVVSVQYLVHPVEVFRDVQRVLKPGGLHLVIFSNRLFPTKAVRIWDLLADDERMELLRHYFDQAGGYRSRDAHIVMGLPRPDDDRYADAGFPSDPVFAVWAEKEGGIPHRRSVPSLLPESFEEKELASRLEDVSTTLCCPYCGEPLRLWAVTENPMTSWDRDFYICVNDACPYVVRGWNEMFRQGNPGKSYRFAWDLKTGGRTTIPIPSLAVIKNELR